MNRSLYLAAVAVVSLMCLPASARILVYEPFAYPDGSLTGRGGALGTTGTWASEESLHPGVGWRVHQEGDTSGIVVNPAPSLARNMFNGTVANLQTAGGYVGLPGPEDVGEPDLNRDFEIGRYMDASISLAPSVTAAFKSGTTTWFSYVAVHAWDRNQETPNFMFCTDPTVLGNRAFSMQNSGNGIGAGGGPPRNNRSDILPRYFREGASYNLRGAAAAWTDDAKEAPDATATMPWVASDPDGFGAANIVVGKIEWDKDTGGEDIITVVGFLETDTMSEKAFDALVALKPELSSKNWTANKPNLDQSQFDLLNVAGTKFFVDEIRIGTTFEDVMGSDPAKANDPKPEAGKADVPRDLVLAWTPGEYANTHDVYLGTVFDDVNDASRNDPRGVLVRQGQSESTYDPGRLAFGTTYYWRIDEASVPPDSTIYKGDVWSFTTEPVGYPVAGKSTKVTASSSEPNQGPENTISGSGMTGDVHSTEMTHMWLTAAGAAGPAWIQYEFDKVLRLHEMWVWNHNGLMEPALGLGAKEVKIEYSIDGNDFKVLGTSHEFARASGADGYVSNTIVNLGGIAAKYVKLTIHSNWGGILTQFGLSEVRFYSVPVFAREPNPASARTGVDVTSSLSWRAGREAGQHKVYLSTDQQAVTDGSAPATTVTSANCTPALNFGATYYWRVDEVNEAMTPSVWPGDIWSFSTPEYLVVDDFESYTNDSPKRVFQAWIDGAGFSADDFFPQGNKGNGSGALIGYDPLAGAIMEKTIIHSGGQSMPMTYDNANVTYSEATRTFDVAQDWTAKGIKTLSLWFRGGVGNGGQLYVRINGAKVPYAGAAGDIAEAVWLPWNIDLSGVSGNLSKVTSLAIGVEGAGAKGMLYLDDIRLYPKAPEYVTPVQPDAAGLLIKYLFDQGAGTSVADGSGNGNAGTINGTPRWVPGVSGTALDFDGAANYVSTGKSLLNSLPAFTIACWLKGDLSAANRSGLIGQNDCVEYGVVSSNTLQIWTAGGGSVGLAWPYSSTDQWHHVTVVGDGTRIVFYLDGRPAASGGAATTSYGTSTFSVNVGGGGVFDATGNYFTGQMDEVYVYQRALSDAEAAALAGRTAPISKAP